jgi:hypothetical protein
MNIVMKTHYLMIPAAIFAMLTTNGIALDINWPMNSLVVVDDPEGAPVDAIQSEPSGHPLILGRPDPWSGTGRFNPSLQDGALVFLGPQTSYVSGFWKNFQAFTIEVDVTFDAVDQDQTLLRVAGVWEIRLVTETGDPTLQFIGWREPLKPQAAPLAGIEAGRKYALKARMEADGTMTFESDTGESATAYLDKSPGTTDQYPELFVGSSNPDRFVRGFQGAIHRLQISAEDSQ